MKQFLSISLLLFLGAVSKGQSNVNLKKCLPTQEELTDYDFSKMRQPKQRHDASFENITFRSLNKDRTFMLGIDIIYTEKIEGAISLVDSTVRNNPGNTWRKGFRFSPSVGETSLHTESVKGKPDSSLGLLVREGRAIIILSYNKLPVGSTLKPVQHSTLSQSDIKRAEDLILLILQKMRRDGLTR